MPDEIIPPADSPAPEAAPPVPIADAAAAAPALHKSGLAYILDAAGKVTQAVADPVNGEAIPLDSQGDLTRYPLTKE